jgi:hypothetical protein
VTTAGISLGNVGIPMGQQGTIPAVLHVALFHVGLRIAIPWIIKGVDIVIHIGIFDKFCCYRWLRVRCCCCSKIFLLPLGGVDRDGKGTKDMKINGQHDTKNQSKKDSKASYIEPTTMTTMATAFRHWNVLFIVSPSLARILSSLMVGVEFIFYPPSLLLLVCVFQLFFVVCVVAFALE